MYALSTPHRHTHTHTNASSLIIHLLFLSIAEHLLCAGYCPKIPSTEHIWQNTSGRNSTVQSQKKYLINELEYNRAMKKNEAGQTDKATGRGHSGCRGLRRLLGRSSERGWEQGMEQTRGRRERGPQRSAPEATPGTQAAADRGARLGGRRAPVWAVIYVLAGPLWLQVESCY